MCERISFSVKSHFLVAFLWGHLQQPKVEGTHAQVLSHGRGSGSSPSLSCRGSSLCTVSDTLFHCNPRHFHPNSQKSQPPIYFLPGWSYETAYILSDYSHHILKLFSSRVLLKIYLKIRPKPTLWADQRHAATQKSYAHGILCFKNWMYGFLILLFGKYIWNYF